MKLLLINSNRLRHPWPVIPYGLACVAAALENTGHVVRFLDLCFSKDPSAEIYAAASSFCPDTVGIGIRNIDNASGFRTRFFLHQIRSEVINPCKAAFQCPIVIGGAAVGISGAEMLHFFDLELAIGGDGEAAMVELMSRLEAKQPLDDVGGLVRRQEGRITTANEPLRTQDLDALPLPRFNRYIDLGKYRAYGSPLQIQTKRGCALRCTYCTYNRIEGSDYRLRDPARIAEEVARLVSVTGINHFEFTDSTFNIPLDHAKAVLKALVEKKMHLRLRAMGLNPGAVDEELVDLMKRAGFVEVDLGVESFCEVTLQGLGKNFTREDALQAGELLRRKRIPVSWYLLLGAPGETVGTVKESIDTVCEAVSPWDLVILGVGIRVYKGAPISKQMARENPGCSEDNFLSPISYSPEKLGLGEIKLLARQASFRHPNLLLYEDDVAYPELLVKFAAAVLNAWAPRQPIWRLHLLYRYILKYSGIDALKRLLFNLRYRRRLSALRRPG